VVGTKAGGAKGGGKLTVRAVLQCWSSFFSTVSHGDLSAAGLPLQRRCGCYRGWRGESASLLCACSAQMCQQLENTGITALQPRPVLVLTVLLLLLLLLQELDSPHAADITAVAFSADGSTMAAADGRSAGAPRQGLCLRTPLSSAGSAFARGIARGACS
jgi:hypothetical protein